MRDEWGLEDKNASETETDTGSETETGTERETDEDLEDKKGHVGLAVKLLPVVREPDEVGGGRV